MGRSVTPPLTIGYHRQPHRSAEMGGGRLCVSPTTKQRGSAMSRSVAVDASLHTTVLRGKRCRAIRRVPPCSWRATKPTARTRRLSWGCSMADESANRRARSKGGAWSPGSKYWRDKAEEARSIGAEVRDPKIQADMERIAD